MTSARSFRRAGRSGVKLLREQGIERKLEVLRRDEFVTAREQLIETIQRQNASAENIRRALEGPLAGIQLVAEQLRRPFEDFLERQQRFDELFVLPTRDLLAPFSDSLSRFNQSIERIATPCIRADLVEKSLLSLARLQDLSTNVARLRAFSTELTEQVRTAVGSWKMADLSPALVSPTVRTGFYIDHGFQPELVMYPRPAFHEAVQQSGLPEVWTSEEEWEDSDDDGLVANKAGYERLVRFERELRAFIARILAHEVGADWEEKRVPPTLLSEWKRKHDEAERKGRPPQDLIQYADFNNYVAIIVRKDNWKLFSGYFTRKSFIEESFARLSPVRNEVMHSRRLTHFDELLLVVETTQIFNAIGCQ